MASRAGAHYRVRSLHGANTKESDYEQETARVTLAAALTAATTIGLASAGVAASANTTTAQHTSRPAGGNVASNERQVRSFLRTVLNEHQADRAASYMTPNVEWGGGTVGTIKGRNNVAGLFAGVIAALPNVHASLKETFGQRHQVLVRLVVSGTQKGAILGIPATGRNVHWDALDVFILKGGKISKIWAGDDWTAILYYTGTYKAPWIPSSKAPRPPSAKGARAGEWTTVPGAGGQPRSSGTPWAGASRSRGRHGHAHGQSRAARPVRYPPDID